MGACIVGWWALNYFFSLDLHHSQLTACVHASCGLLYPMHWEHILIPTLPPHLLDYCCAPMPYLIGVHTSLIERVRDKALEDVVILNVDTNTLESPFQDVETLPPDVVSLLRLRLRKEALAAGDGVSRLFLRAQALLFGGYRDALIYSHVSRHPDAQALGEGIRLLGLGGRTPQSLKPLGYGHGCR